MFSSLVSVSTLLFCDLQDARVDKNEFKHHWNVIYNEVNMFSYVVCAFCFADEHHMILTTTIFFAVHASFPLICHRPLPCLLKS